MTAKLLGAPSTSETCANAIVSTAEAGNSEGYPNLWYPIFIRGNLLFFSLTSTKITTQFILTRSIKKMCSKFRGCQTKEK